MITVNLEAGDLAQKVAEALAMMLPGEERLLTISQAAERLAIGESTLYNMIHAGDIPTVGEGKLRRIRYGALVEWMRANEKRA